ncbi:chloride channel protein [Roseomonas sp. 573]|uniref:Chloride channel protein n=1 Tax=Roseomonas haemaphysalidis TaxID=2768162 RepID=A0ABS3KK69_9PROT|nr:chloride channel protein [Roseomonas haemaphysalidis]MBO1077864.1 chloride channel protein [Roseomonas haemaphysalidis]
MPALTPRRRRRLRIVSRKGGRLALFVAGGLVVGAAAVGIAQLADHASALFAATTAGRPWLALLLTPLAFLASAFIARRWFPNSGGSGIPQAIAARRLHGLAARERLVSLRIAVGKTLLLAVGLLGGASIGREGPTVQVGASIMFAVGRLSPRRQPGLIMAGAGAGVAAAFNTPLAGIVFAIEEMGRSFDERTNGIVISTVIAAGLTSLAIQGDYTYFGTTGAALGGSWQGWLAVPLLGIAGGLLGGGFSRLLVLFAGGLPGRAGAALKRHPLVVATVCGLLVALCGLASGGAVFGTGYAQAQALVQGDGEVSAGFGVLKLLATLLSSVSGIPGGIFAPSLSVGAGLGSNMAALLPGAPAQALIVLGMVAYFSGVVQAPITAFVIVEEMTGDHHLVVPLMLASLIGFAASRLVCREGVYHALARNFVAAEAARSLPPPRGGA